MKKRVFLIFLLSFLFVLSACNKKENVEEKKVEPLPVSDELFLYEGTQDARVIAVDEEGYLYTATCITEIDTEKEIKASEYVYKPFVQLFKVYDLEGNCIQEVEVGVGNGDIQFLTAKEGKLYCIVTKSMLADYRPTLYTIDTKTWEVTELYGFDDYSSIDNFVQVGDYFYVIGQLKDMPNKNYELHSSVISYTYSGECISRIKVGEEVPIPQEERLPIDFPMDIVGTKQDTLLIYYYSEEEGFGFLEFRPEENLLENVGWKTTSTGAAYFTECEQGFIFSRGGGTFYGTVDGLEAEISSHDIFIWNPPIYQRGFLFYINYVGDTKVVERFGISNLIKKNTPISLLIDEITTGEPYGCGYSMQKNVQGLEKFALKVLAQDSDFDVLLLESRNEIAYNVKEKGAFYTLNEVEGVQEYLDACFPYVKETAMNEEGDIWMIPVSLEIPGLLYHKEYCETNQVDLSKMNFGQFLNFVEKVELEVPEQGGFSTFVMIEELFYQYLSDYDNFDTDVFRDYAKKIQLLIEKVGNLTLDNAIFNELSKDNLFPFFYRYNRNVEKIFTYMKKLEDSNNAIGVVGIPKVSEDLGNVGTVTFLAVNANSENLEATLAYISEFCQYMMTQKDTFLLADESMYTDEPFVKEWYEVYANGSIFFGMDRDIYWNLFWDYVDGKVELEEMIEEIERKRNIYVEE